MEGVNRDVGQELGGDRGVPLSVNRQWEKTRDQLLGGVPKGEEVQAMARYEQIWRELQNQGKVPRGFEKIRLVRYLGEAEREAAKEVQEHEAKGQGSIWNRRRFKQQREVKEQRRADLHIITLACMAVEANLQHDIKQGSHNTKENTGEVKPSAPLYPELPETLPPPYPIPQMPAMQISEGIVNVTELTGPELHEAKERLKRVAQGRVEETKEWVHEVQNDRCAVRKNSRGLGSTDERELGQEENRKGNDPASVRWEREREQDEDTDLASVSVENEEEEQPVTIRGSMITHRRQSQDDPRTPLGYALRDREEVRLPERYRQMPLIYKGPQIGERYQPFSFTDMNCILDKMPPPTEGGGAWMGKFCQYTMGHKIAIGDWRALLGKQLGLWEIQQVEMIAGITRCLDAEPFANHATAIGGAMRDKFPVSPGVMQSLTFSIKEDEEISTFLSQCRESWTDKAGVHPATDPLQTTLFRAAVTSGLPAVVREALENNPDIPGCSSEQWEKHLTHHMKRYRAKQKEDKHTMESAQVQLLKLQLEEARKKANEAKKISSKGANQMIQQPTQPPQGNNMSWHPAPCWAPGPTYVARMGGPMGGFRVRGRGRGAPRMQPAVCFVCGQPGHWKRDCPLAWDPRDTGGRGYGPPQNEHWVQSQRSSVPPPVHQAPHAALAPKRQFPLLTEEEQYCPQ
ncbi:uncharacterized protein [Narcine bancroftii]|uniref:uncharacterized protein n=1 Tax=Narcine bancroftii TaxID=1343680 RepID=UPI00383222A4